jgi:TonB family protein
MLNKCQGYSIPIPFMGGIMTTASLGFQQGSWQDPDDEDEGPGRVLTLEEFMERLQNRPDIFGVDKSYRLRNTEILTLVIALMAGLWASSASKAINLRTDAYEPTLTGDATVTLRGTIDRSFVKPSEVKRPAAVADNGKRVLRTAKANASRTSGPSGRGVGSIHSRIVKQGILSVLSNNIVGKDVAGDMFGKGGFTEKIDAMIRGVGGLKQGGRTSTGRLGAVGMGFGPGAGSSGFGGPGPGGLGDWYDNLMSPQAGQLDLTPTRGPPVLARLTPKIDVQDRFGQTIGGRSKSEIMRVVMQNISVLRYAYNKRLREKPGLKGKITVKFAIDEFGNVLHCKVVESSVADNALENTVTGKIIRWKFERIDKPGDITEVVYPFVFST